MPPDAKRSGPDTTPDRPRKDSDLAAEANATVAQMLQRRREASWRLAQFGGGRRDPLDALARQPIRAAQRCHGAVCGPGGRWQPCCRGAA
jgi:hypothetical protein